MNYCVLGSRGLIGQALYRYLENQGHKVIGLDIKNGPDQDLRFESEKLNEAIGNCDFVFYLASEIGGAKYLKNHQDSSDFIISNMQIMSVVFSTLKKYNKPFIFTSSQMVDMPFSTYGVLKSLGEKITKDLNGIFVRFWNVYGHEEANEKSHVINDFIEKSKFGEIEMMTNGEESRQFLHVNDCVECLLTLAEKYDNLDRDKKYHITSFKWNSIFEVAKIVSKLSNAKIKRGVKQDTVQANSLNPPDSYILNFWLPKTDLEDGIKLVYDK